MWTCSGCGERIEEPFDTCWRCGTPKEGERSPTEERTKTSEDRGETPYHVPRSTDAPPILDALTTEEALHQIFTLQNQQQEVLKDIQSKVGCLFAYMMVGIIISVFLVLAALIG